MTLDNHPLEAPPHEHRPGATGLCKVCGQAVEGAEPVQPTVSPEPPRQPEPEPPPDDEELLSPAKPPEEEETP